MRVGGQSGSEHGANLSGSIAAHAYDFFELFNRRSRRTATREQHLFQVACPGLVQPEIGVNDVACLADNVDIQVGV